MLCIFTIMVWCWRACGRLNLTINYATCSVLIQTLRISTCKFQSHQVLKLYLVGYISVRLFSLHHNRVVQKEMFEKVGACILQFLSSFTISISSFTQLSQVESISDNPFPLSHSFHRWKVFRGIKCSLNIIAFHVSLSAGCPQSSANHPSVH